jgi:hypothetical protein
MLMRVIDCRTEPTISKFAYYPRNSVPYSQLLICLTTKYVFEQEHYSNRALLSSYSCTRLYVSLEEGGA